MRPWSFLLVYGFCDRWTFFFYQKDDDDDKAHETEALSTRKKDRTPSYIRIEPAFGIAEGTLWAFEAEFSLAPLFLRSRINDCLWACLPAILPTYSPWAFTNLISTYSRFLRPDTTHSKRTLCASLAATTTMEQGRGA